MTVCNVYTYHVSQHGSAFVSGRSKCSTNRFIAIMELGVRVIVAPAECVTLLNEVFYLLRNKCNAIKQRTWNKTLTKKSKFEYGKKKTIKRQNWSVNDRVQQMLKSDFECICQNTVKNLELKCFNEFDIIRLSIVFFFFNENRIEWIIDEEREREWERRYSSIPILMLNSNYLLSIGRNKCLTN